MGPNVKRLIAYKMSFDAIPPGGGFAAGVDFLLSPGRLAQSGQAAVDWVKQSISLVKSAPDNPYGDDDEAIAGALLERLEVKTGTRVCSTVPANEKP